LPVRIAAGADSGPSTCRSRIEPATANDILQIRAAYANGRETQRRVGSPVWPEFADEAILQEIGGGCLFRVIDDQKIAGVFSVAHEDPAIWGELERGAHVYLHRIARAADWNGRGLMDVILSWAVSECHSLGRAGIRVDTWASNAELIAFYQRRGFTLVGNRQIGVDSRLPPHYHHSEFALLECAVA
jgi:GNAT superfamily N-acetyltransferase